ncbi:hypothetical protein R1flu_026038 [Riccia fluitans]|uniref:Uncharacterized protein n=1 Tax=Riccia fluitans TaxID=41844 RepID=A0ABD1XFA1_9MARC
MEYTDLNPKDHDDSGYSLLPDFGLPSGYLKRLQSELRSGTYFHSVEISREIDGSDFAAAVAFQKSFASALITALSDRFENNNIISCFKIFNPREVPSSALGMRDWGCSELEVLVQFYGDNKVLESGRTMQALVSPGSVKENILSKALELWKRATTHRFIYSNPTVHLSGFQVSDFTRRSVPEVPDPEQAPGTKEDISQGVVGTKVLLLTVTSVYEWYQEPFVNMSKKQGERMARTESANDIPKFIEFFQDRIKVEEFKYPVEHYQTFNEFFVRELKPGCRPIAHEGNDAVAVCGADCRLMA